MKKRKLKQENNEIMHAQTTTKQYQKPKHWQPSQLIHNISRARRGNLEEIRHHKITNHTHFGKKGDKFRREPFRTGFHLRFEISLSQTQGEIKSP